MAIVLFLVSLVFVAAAVLAALKFDVIYNLVKIGDSAERQMHLANKAALIVTAAMALVLQIIHVAKLNKTKLGLTIVAQIAAIGLILLSDFVLIQIYKFSDIFAWGIALGAFGFMLMYIIWQSSADPDFPEEAASALGKSLSTFAIALIFLALPCIFAEKITTFIQVVLVILMAVGMIAGMIWDKTDEWEARAWITTGIYAASQVILGIVFAIVNAIFGMISVGGIIAGIIIILSLIHI